MIEAGGSLLTVTVEETPMKNGGAHWHFRCTWMRAARQSSAAVRRARYLLSVLPAAGLWYRRPVTEAGQRALIAYKRTNWFATPPHTPNAIAIRRAAVAGRR